MGRWTGRLWPNSQEEPEAKRQDLIRRQRSHVESWPIVMCTCGVPVFQKSGSTTSETRWSKTENTGGDLDSSFQLITCPSLGPFWRLMRVSISNILLYDLLIFKRCPILALQTSWYAHSYKQVSFPSSGHCWGGNMAWGLAHQRDAAYAGSPGATSEDREGAFIFINQQSIILLTVSCQQSWSEDTWMLDVLDHG